ncbi:hypothetical protein NADFUDRAFT_53493 [Nadsonia fulvescens var. elongata DSM 6958]|uniref:Uncharacterized protein n=1 Tax=Nadsonia fulvescens var. elongata DSM 6958 TaxID=857566 RepID=A0A1E3PD60_9ASCO|nr:hypothetical protein NADFUDRAFT_53493 [Nadsonia fulvescens var. elongata DSM 6958]
MPGWLNINPPVEDAANRTEETVPSTSGAFKFALGAFPTIFNGTPTISGSNGQEPLDEQDCGPKDISLDNSEVPISPLRHMSPPKPITDQILPQLLMGPSLPNKNVSFAPTKTVTVLESGPDISSSSDSVVFSAKKPDLVAPKRSIQSALFDKFTSVGLSTQLQQYLPYKTPNTTLVEKETQGDLTLDNDQMNQILNSTEFANSEHVTIPKSDFLEFVLVKNEIEATNEILEALLTKSSTQSEKNQSTNGAMNLYWKKQYDQLKLEVDRKLNHNIHLTSKDASSTLSSEQQIQNIHSEQKSLELAQAECLKSTELKGKLALEIETTTAVLQEYASLSREAQSLQSELLEERRRSELRLKQLQAERIKNSNNQRDAELTSKPSESNDRLKVNEYYDQIQDRDRTISHLNSKLVSMVSPSEHLKLQHELDQLKISHYNKISQIQQLEQQNRILTEQSATDRSNMVTALEFSNIKGQLIQANQRAQALQSQLADATAFFDNDRQKYINHVQSLEDQMTARHAQHQATLASRDRDITSLQLATQTDIANLRNTIEALHRDKLRLESELSSFRGDYTSLEMERMALEKVLHTKINDIDQLANTVESLKQEKRRNTATIAALIASGAKESKERNNHNINDYETVYGQQLPGSNILGSTTPAMPPPERVLKAHNAHAYHNHRHSSEAYKNYNDNLDYPKSSPRSPSIKDVTMANASIVDHDYTPIQQLPIPRQNPYYNHNLESIKNDPGRLEAARKRIRDRMRTGSDRGVPMSVN